MSHEILLRELKLGSEDKPFVVVGVLRTEGPTAIRAGNKAIILADGSVEGWIGGHCTEDEIVSTALDCLQDGTTRFLNLTTCQGGRMDVYLEPYLPKRRLIVFGHVPIVGALARLGKLLNFSVTVVDKKDSKQKFPEADFVWNMIDDEQTKSIVLNASQTYAIVATMGEFDLEYIAQLISLDLPYIGIVAGKKRASEIYSYLRSKKVPEEKIEKIKAPAGVYIRAMTAEEIALSIMAEVVELSRSQSSKDFRELARNVSDKELHSNEIVENLRQISSGIRIDPVCGMTVDDSTPYRANLGNQAVFFCSESCKEAFERDPQKYVLASS